MEDRRRYIEELREKVEGQRRKQQERKRRRAASSMGRLQQQQQQKQVEVGKVWMDQFEQEGGGRLRKASGGGTISGNLIRGRTFNLEFRTAAISLD